MGNSTISIAIFNSEPLNYQRVITINHNDFSQCTININIPNFVDEFHITHYKSHYH